MISINLFSHTTWRLENKYKSVRYLPPTQNHTLRSNDSLRKFAIQIDSNSVVCVLNSSQAVIGRQLLNLSAGARGEREEKHTCDVLARRGGGSEMERCERCKATKCARG
jgi:hypothetical protein